MASLVQRNVKEAKMYGSLVCKIMVAIFDKFILPELSLTLSLCTQYLKFSQMLDICMVELVRPVWLVKASKSYVSKGRLFFTHKGMVWLSFRQEIKGTVVNLV